MEYLQGQTIKDYVLKNGTMTVEQAKYIAGEVASALITTHSANVLHRDVSPDNIMLCGDGKIKLIDFGAARQVISEMSQNFSVILKPGFAPIEQYQKNGRQSPRTDIYSLGTTLYYCLTGKIPEDPMSRLENDNAFASELMSVDENFRNIIMKAAALKTEDRYGSAAELLNDLKNGSHVPAANDSEQQRSEGGAQTEKYSAEYVSADTAQEVNVYGEASAAGNNKPLIIAAALGVIIVVLIVFLIVFLLNGKEDDTVLADAETQNVQTTANNYDNEAAKTKPQTEQPQNTVKIGGEFYDINMIGTLDLSGKGLTDEDIINLKYMTRVSELILNDNELTDLSPVSELKALQKLSFHHNSVADISFAENLRVLTSIGAGDNGISDISVFSEMPGLKEIWIFDNNISDISPMYGLKYLEYVDVSDNQIADLTPLAGKKLITLKASNNKLNGNYDAIAGLSIFDELHLDGNGYDADPDGFYKFTGMFQTDSSGFTYWI